MIESMRIFEKRAYFTHEESDGNMYECTSAIETILLSIIALTNIKNCGSIVDFKKANGEKI
jgi:hypothetical protein